MKIGWVFNRVHIKCGWSYGSVSKPLRIFLYLYFSESLSTNNNVSVRKIIDICVLSKYLSKNIHISISESRLMSTCTAWTSAFSIIFDHNILETEIMNMGKDPIDIQVLFGSVPTLVNSAPRGRTKGGCRGIKG